MTAITYVDLNEVEAGQENWLAVIARERAEAKREEHKRRLIAEAPARYREYEKKKKRQKFLQLANLKFNENHDPETGRFTSGGGSGSSQQSGSGSESTGASNQGGSGDSGGVRGETSGVESSSAAAPVSTERLAGSPTSAEIKGVGTVAIEPNIKLRQAAADYCKKAGIQYDPPTSYVKVDKERAKKIADAYEQMKNDPEDPEVKAAYAKMAEETIAQYQAALDAGLKVEFIDYAKTGDPYAVSPRLAIEDVKNNNHFWVFPTEGGFGTDANFDASKNPLLAPTEFKISGKTACVNDLFRCFVPGTLVRTRDGFSPIERLKIGDEVLTHRGRWRKITATMTRMHVGEVVDVKTNASHEPITSTADHAFFVLQGKHDKRKKSICTPYICGRKQASGKFTNQDKSHHFKWKEIGEVQKGEWFPITVDTEVVDLESVEIPIEFIAIHPTHGDRGQPKKFELTPEFLWLVGLYIAEGSSSPTSNSIKFTLHKKETVFVDRIKKFSASCGYGYAGSKAKDGITITTPGNGNGICVSVNSKTLGDWFPAWLGRGANNKRIPAELLRLPAHKLFHLIRGIMDGDGRKRDGNIMQTSETLALQLVEAGIRLGFQPTTHKVCIDGHELHHHAYTVHEVCEKNHNTRQKKYCWRILNADCRNFTSITRRQYTGFVYDIEVEEDHSFVVQNVPVHNCVHDYFGHCKEGNGMRADGEENAWRSHSAMFTPLARRAMTSETRGQNSWVNFGPYAEHNKTASGGETHYADQKVGLLPEWVTNEGAKAIEFIQFTKTVETKIARAAVKAAYAQQHTRVENQAAKHLTGYFRSSVKQIVDAIPKFTPDPENARSQAANLIKRAFKKSKQNDLLIAHASQTVADAFLEGAYAEMRMASAAKRRKKAASLKFNENHDELGRFATGDGSGGSSEGSKPAKVTETPEFKQWFKDSKVLDDKGKPLIVYHGTTAKEEFNEFKGGWFTPDRAEAEEYAAGIYNQQGGHPRVVAAYLSISNPVEAKGGSVDVMKEQGFDGMKINTFDGKVHWLPFTANQIKSIDNEGKFDANNPDIRKSHGVKITTATQAARRAQEQIDFPTTAPDWLTEAAQDFIIETFQQDYWLRIPETTRDDIQLTLYNAIADGKSIRDIAQDIQDAHGDEYSKYRALNVARTEMTGAMNAGATESISQAFEGTGITPTKVWLSVLGTTTRDTHAEADGQEVLLDAEFTVGGYQCNFPGDVSLPPEERCNCQCSLISGEVESQISDEEDDKAFDPDQPRDDSGRWTGTGGSAPDTGDGSGAQGTSPSEAKPESKPADKPPKSVEEVVKRAEKIQFTEGEIASTIDSSDTSAIYDRMTSEERDSMREALDQERDEWVNEQMDSWEADDSILGGIDDEYAAKEAGYTERDIKNDVGEMVADNEKLSKVVEEWDGRWGTDGIEMLIEELDNSGEEISSELRDKLEAYKNEAEDNIQTERDHQYESLTEEARDAARESYADQYDNNSSDNERAYLERFYEDNPERFQSEDQLGQWVKNKRGTSQFSFKTSDDRRFDINTYQQDRAGLKTTEVQFSDEGGNFDMTGKGKAFEVFGQVVPAVVAYAKHEDPTVMTFSAHGKSRQRLYDRLTQQVLGLDDSRFAFKKDLYDGDMRQYVVGKKSERDTIMAKISAEMRQGIEEINPRRSATVDASQLGAGWQEIFPHSDPAWFTEEGWPELPEEPVKTFDPNQPRDDSGKWTSEGGSSTVGNDHASPEPSDSPEAKLTSDRLFKASELSLPKKALQVKSTKEDLYAQAEVEKPKFDKGLNTGQGVDKAIGATVARPTNAEEFNKAIESDGPTVIIAGLKGEKRAEEKVNGKYGGDWTKLTDVIRATIAVVKKDEIPGAVEALRKEMADHGWQMAEKPDNRIINPTPGGYRDLNLLFRSESGHLAEIQVNTKAMIRAKQGDGHKLYEEYRVIDEAIKSAKREPTAEESASLTELAAKMKTLYNDAWAK